MIFKRVDDTTIRCMVSKEDLEEYDISLEDFFKDVHKSRSFIQLIVERAKEEADFETHSDALSVQVMVIPPDSIAITLSEENVIPDISRIANDFKDLASDIDEFGLGNPLDDLMSKEESKNFDNFLKSLENVIKNEIEENKKSSKGIKEIKENTKEKRHVRDASTAGEEYLRILRFNSFDDAENFAKAAYTGKNIKSRLYRAEKGNICYLVIEKGRNSLSTFNHICDIAQEFAVSEKYCMNRAVYIREHCECLIKEKAIERLALL